ncbi:inhibitor of nuclear factor kappa-B kinase subunit alpha-like [Asterias amurensis]|uniref:inhibitor of nuclear factor kappa-B kinase subunit alpha-like n=1 Tax=Asterias amurensis TaxID=7602 RepID=UPI003AB7F07B
MASESIGGSQAVKERGDWLLQGTLGQGGFGMVTLWEHKESKETLAVKQCRVNLDPKNRKRWTMEVDIMERLDHDHIVKAKKVPFDTSIEGELPLLGMEHCRKGDLRKVLSRPENSCGLAQDQVLDIAKHVCSGVEYLHSNRIIHRDLKPENIVLQENENGQIIYKLIDLGYAKDLDQGSVASTFVGTLQYLAPELYASQKYTLTVDYWTLGTVLFECITGVRPFLPQMPPVKWHGTVKQKTDKEICAYMNGEGGVVFTEKLLQPNHLTKRYQETFEVLLRVMLKFDPENRGGGLEQGTGRPRCFTFLDKVLEMQIINVLCMTNDMLYSYCIQDTVMVSAVQGLLEKDTNIPIREQDILLPTGQVIDPDKPAVHYTKGENHPGFLMFLFPKGLLPEWVPAKPKPDLVNMIIQEPKIMLAYTDRKRAFAHAVFFCSQQAKEASRLLEGARAAMLCLMRLNGHLTDVHKQMMSHMQKLEAKLEMFHFSLEYDVTSYAVQASKGITSEKMFRNWKAAEKELDDEFKALQQVHVLNNTVMRTQTRLTELQRSPLSRQRQVDGLTEVESSSHKLYQELQKSKNNPATPPLQDCSDMQHLIINSITLRNKQTKELYRHLQNLVTCKMEVDQVTPKILSCITRIRKLEERMMSCQHQRQTDIWILLKHVMGQLSRANAAQPGETSFSRQSSTSTSLGSNSFTRPVGALLSLSPAEQRPLQESREVVDQSLMTRSRFEDFFETVKMDHGELLEEAESDKWKFLKTEHVANTS